MLTPNFTKPEDRDRYEAFMEELVELVIEKYDGSLKAEHGTGRNMAPFVEREWGAKATGLPVLVSFICKDGREVLSGESLEDAVRAVEPLKPDAVLVNCVGPETAAECLLTMGRATRVPLGCYPNAGEPDLDKRAWCFDPSWTPERFAEVAGTWLARGAQIIGGCCGTGPEHIRALRLALPPVLVE